MMLELTPISLAEANEFVECHHRHHKKVVGAKFCIGVSKDNKICGVGIIGRPIARHLDNGWTLEVNRVATNGQKNACSILYAAAWRAAKAMGYRKLITYTLANESGSSLRGAGWKVVGEVKGRSWP